MATGVLLGSSSDLMSLRDLKPTYSLYVQRECTSCRANKNGFIAEHDMIENFKSGVFSGVPSIIQTHTHTITLTPRLHQ